MDALNKRGNKRSEVVPSRKGKKSSPGFPLKRPQRGAVSISFEDPKKLTKPRNALAPTKKMLDPAPSPAEPLQRKKNAKVKLGEKSGGLGGGEKDGHISVRVRRG